MKVFKFAIIGKPILSSKMTQLHRSGFQFLDIVTFLSRTSSFLEKVLNKKRAEARFIDNSIT